LTIPGNSAFNTKGLKTFFFQPFFFFPFGLPSGLSAEVPNEGGSPQGEVGSIICDGS